VSGDRQRAFWVIAVALLLLTRLPAVPHYLSIDNVSLAFSLEHFDPLNHQPQPPGYPFFVGFARVVKLAVGSAETSFIVIALIVSGLCLPLTILLGARMFSPRAGQTAALLLLFNPVFWHAGLDGPLRPNLALFSLGVAYCAWRAWNGEARWVLWGAAVLGVGSGVRPDLLAYLGPLWLISAIVGTRSVWVTAQGAAVLASIVAVWIGILAHAVGGVWALVTLIRDYLVTQSQGESLLLGAGEAGWGHQVNRLVTWNALAVIGWAWAAPFAILSRTRLRLRNPRVPFLFIWLVPGLVFQALVHVANPGHTLFSVPVFCLIGGYAIWAASEYLTAEPQRLAEGALGGALVVNLLLFLNFFSLPVAAGRFVTAVTVGVYESSLGDLRGLEDVHRTTVSEWKALSEVPRPSVIVTTDEAPQRWFMHWLMLRYYAPKSDIWVLAAKRTPRQVLLVRRNDTLSTRTGDVIDVPVPAGGRILWVLESRGPFETALERTIKIEKRVRLSYTDLAPDAAPFQVLNFRFVPTMPSALAP